MTSARQEIRVSTLHEPISHYTDAVVCGDFVYVSGCTAADENLDVVGGEDVAAQARQVLTTIGQILSAAGAGFEDVVKVTVYLTDVDDRPAINPVRQEFFGETRPASTLIGISRLAVPGAKVEIDAVAYVGDKAGA